MVTANSGVVSRGEIIGGHYELDHVLAEGGMGIVWTARDLRLGRSVAVKFLGPTAINKPMLRERFAREARLASRIRSPHVVQIFGDGVTAGGVPFVVMELLDGESLAALLAREKRCRLPMCGSVIEQVCRALSSAHAEGLVHRDIKPANIFLTPQRGGDVFVRLLDFGIAKELHVGLAGLTQAGELLGTANYMSPEQFRQPEAITAATDIWSLGVVLYEMLTGRVPFEASTFPNLALRIIEGKFRPASAVCPDLPAASDAVVGRALALEPSQRFASSEEFCAAFLRIVRANTSESVIRPDVLRALQGHATTLQASAPAQTRAGEPLRRVLPRPTLWGALLVLACGVVLISSWLILERYERSIALPDVQPVPVQVGELPPPGAETAPPTAIEALAPHTIDPGVAAEPVVEALPAATQTTETSVQAASADPDPTQRLSPTRTRRKRGDAKPRPAPASTPAPAAPSPVAPVPVNEFKYGF